MRTLPSRWEWRKVNGPVTHRQTDRRMWKSHNLLHICDDGSLREQGSVTDVRSHVTRPGLLFFLHPRQSPAPPRQDRWIRIDRNGGSLIVLSLVLVVHSRLAVIHRDSLLLRLSWSNHPFCYWTLRGVSWRTGTRSHHLIVISFWEK